MTHNIAMKPCQSCPYRKDVPKGIWDQSEYDKLPRYDLPTYDQPHGVFLCHQQNGCLCRGWLDCHGEGLLAIRLASAIGNIDNEQLAEALESGPAVQCLAVARKLHDTVSQD